MIHTINNLLARWLVTSHSFHGCFVTLTATRIHRQTQQTDERLASSAMGDIYIFNLKKLLCICYSLVTYTVLSAFLSLQKVSAEYSKRRGPKQSQVFHQSTHFQQQKEGGTPLAASCTVCPCTTMTDSQEHHPLGRLSPAPKIVSCPSCP